VHVAFSLLACSIELISLQELSYNDSDVYSSRLDSYSITDHLIGWTDGTSTTYDLTDAQGSVLMSLARARCRGSNSTVPTALIATPRARWARTRATPGSSLTKRRGWHTITRALTCGTSACSSRRIACRATRRAWTRTRMWGAIRRRGRTRRGREL
jgi:hypothetical protein